MEAPPEAAAQGYAATPPSWGSALMSMFHETSPSEMIGRWYNRGLAGAQGFSGRLARSALSVIGGTAGLNNDQLGLTPNEELQHPSPALPASEANDKYAPVGPDGKKTSITSQPMPEAVAQLVGNAKADHLERQGVIARFENAHSWPVNFGTGMAAFLMDPLNAASAFIPGFGEEATATALGGGFLARVIGRTVAGATGGALSQAPLTALKLGLSGEEGDDYTARSAFRDMAFAAAGNALFSAGIGTAAEALRRPATKEPAAEAPSHEMPGEAQARAITTADAKTKYDAMKTAVAQVAEGREVNVEPIFPAPKTSTAIGMFLPPAPGESLAHTAARVSVDDLARRIDPDTFVHFDRLAAEREAAFGAARDPAAAGAEIDSRRAALIAQAANEPERALELNNQAFDLAEKREYLVQDAMAKARVRGQHADEAMRDLATRVTSAYDAARAQLGLDEAMRQSVNPTLDTQGRPISPNVDWSRVLAENPGIRRQIDLARFATSESEIARDGYSPALAQPEYDKAAEAIYHPKEEIPAPKPEAAPEGEPATPVTDLDRQFAAAQEDLSRMTEQGTALHPEDAAEIDAANVELEKSDRYEAAATEAAGCLP